MLELPVGLTTDAPQPILFLKSIHKHKGKQRSIKRMFFQHSQLHTLENDENRIQIKHNCMHKQEINNKSIHIATHT